MSTREKIILFGGVPQTAFHPPWNQTPGSTVESNTIRPKIVTGPVESPSGVELIKGTSSTLMRKSDWSCLNQDSTHIIEDVAGGIRYYSGSGSPILSMQQNAILTVGKKYRITLAGVVKTSGTLNTDAFTGFVLANGTQDLVATYTGFNLYRNGAVVDVTIGSISVQELVSNFCIPAGTDASLDGGAWISGPATFTQGPKRFKIRGTAPVFYGDVSTPSITIAGTVYQFPIHTVSGPVNYIVSGESVWIRGPLSDDKHFAQNYAVPVDQSSLNGQLRYGDGYVLSPSAANSVASFQAGEHISGFSDDHCPALTINAGYLMAGHGMYVPVVTSTGHDKTSVDIGSVWSDGTHQFKITAVSGSNITLFSVPFGDPWATTYAVAGTLSHVSGATHTGNIAITSQAPAQKYPVVKNLVKTILKNGVTDITTGGSGAAQFVDLVEEFDLVDQSALDVNSPWQWNSGPVWMHVKNTFRCTAGSTVVKSKYDILRPMNVGQFGIIQSGLKTITEYPARSRYVPGTLDFEARESFDATTASVYITNARLKRPGKPPEREICFFSATTPDKAALGHAFGFGPFGDTAKENRSRDQTGSWYFTFVGGKSYPVAKGNTLFADPVSFEFWAHRKFIDLSQYGDNKSVYFTNMNGRDLVYIDYHCSALNDLVAIPSEFEGRTVLVVDSETMTVAESVVSGGALHVSTTGNYGFMVIELVA